MNQQQASNLNEIRFMWIWHADLAEQRLVCDGIMPELIAYIVGIGEAYR